MNIGGAVLADEYAGAVDRWPWLHDVERAHGLPRCLLFAVGSRETNLQEKFTQGATGDGGHGHGVFQLDDRWHDIPAGFDTDPHAQAETAATMLADLYQRHGDWLAALNTYNSGSPLTEKTTGHDYGPDVLERRDYLAARNEEAPMATAQAALEFYRQNEGLDENPPGSNVNWISEWYGMTGAWCAMTVSRALIAAGFGTPERIDVPGLTPTSAKGWAYVPYLRQAFIDAGRYDQTPQVGDVVIFAWGPGEPIGDHTGLLDEIVGDGSFLVWEGNTDEGVIRRKRRTMAVIDGFGHPPYSEATTHPPEGDLSMLTFRYIFNGLDWVFDGPSKLFFQLDDTRQITEVLDPLGVKALGQVSDVTHRRYSELAATAGFAG